jgi:DDE superfamily endonuclease
VEGLTSVIGHADRTKPLRDYCLGLMMPCERKSVEPMAAITAPERTAAQHQSLLHFIGEGGWSDEKVLAKVRKLVLPVLDATGRSKRGLSTTPAFPRKGIIRSGWLRSRQGLPVRAIHNTASTNSRLSLLTQRGAAGILSFEILGTGREGRCHERDCPGCLLTQRTLNKTAQTTTKALATKMPLCKFTIGLPLKRFPVILKHSLHA